MRTGSFYRVFNRRRWWRRSCASRVSQRTGFLYPRGLWRCGERYFAWRERRKAQPLRSGPGTRLVSCPWRSVVELMLFADFGQSFFPFAFVGQWVGVRAPEFFHHLALRDERALRLGIPVNAIQPLQRELRAGHDGGFPQPLL